MEATTAAAALLAAKEKSTTNKEIDDLSVSESYASLLQSDGTESGEESDLDLSATSSDLDTCENQENDEQLMQKGSKAEEKLEELSGVSGAEDVRAIDNQQGSEDGRSSEHSLDISTRNSSQDEAEEEVESHGVSHESSSTSDSGCEALVLLSDEDVESAELQSPNTETVDENRTLMWSVSSLDLTDDAKEIGENGDDEDDALWAAFDSELEVYVHMNENNGAFEEAISSPVDNEEAYDGSVSDISSSDHLDMIDEHDAPTDTKKDADAEYSGIQHRNHYFEALHMESFCISSESDSSVSSLMSSTGSEHELLYEVESAVSSLDNEDTGDSRRWIENIPQLEVEPPRYCATSLQQNQKELPLFWLPNQYIVAKTRARKREKSHAVAHPTPHDCENIELVAQNVESAPAPQFRARHIQRHEHNLQTHDSYVSYSDIAGIIEHHVPCRGGICVDLGCGTSELCHELAFHGYSSVWGVDCDRDVIQFQKSHTSSQELRKYVHFLQTSTEALGFADESCELVISKATLDEIASKCAHEAYPLALVNTITEIVRCLKPGGALIVISYQAQWLGNEDAAYDNQDMSTWTPEECHAIREMAPWWTWAEVNGMIERQLYTCASYDLGKPQLIDGILIKPYVVRVWRRKASLRARVQRYLVMKRDEKWGQLDIQSRIQLQKRRLLMEEEDKRTVQELRAMILEDERTRFVEKEKLDEESFRLRASRRAAILTAMLEDDRHLMITDDGLSLRCRNNQMKASSVAENLDFIIGRAVNEAEGSGE